MCRTSMISRLAHRVLPFVAALAFLAPVALTPPQPETRIGGASHAASNLLDHVRTRRSPMVNPAG
jgi:hypothetical protein